jgi:hypothetical protein
MGLWAVLTHLLAQLMTPQKADHMGPHDKRKDQRRKSSQNCAQRKIMNDIKQSKML